ncbi:MAG: O-antigen ligase family protein [Verrucomicrobiota bacterium]
MLFTTWAFGGMASWARMAICLWGSLSLGLSAAFLLKRKWHAETKVTLRWLWPPLLFNALVLCGLFNPSFGDIMMEGERMAFRREEIPYLPSITRPVTALNALWLFDVLYLSCFNLALIVRRRGFLRGLLLLTVVNALALAVFGIAQSITNASGLYFGAIRSPQPYFFASFVYHNHWGAFTLLMTAACIALTWRRAQQNRDRDFLHSPAMAGVVAVFLLGLTIPLSGSRSSTLLLILLLAAALVHCLTAVVRRRRALRESPWPPILITVAILVVGGVVGYDMAKPMIERRLEHTLTQVHAAQSKGDFGARPILYRDTWRMAQAKLAFGWGMGSYPTVFQLFNSNRIHVPATNMHSPIYYHDAHSDWLQSLAEVGIVGTALLVLTALVPFWSIFRLRSGALSLYLFLGCLLVVIYAAIEFPFGNIAVVLFWWFLFFSAVAYARLTASRAAKEASSFSA